MFALDYIVLVLYFVGLVAVSLVMSRRIKSSEDMFIAGRNSSWWLSGVSSYMTIFFVLVEKTEGDPVFTGHVQISQDGVHWTGDGSAPVSFKGEGQHAIKVQPNFGNWLRLAVKIEGGSMFLNLHIACKG